MAHSPSTATVVPIPEHQADGAAPESRRFSDPAAFGAFLRSHRESRNIAVQQIAERTKLSVRLLTALEAGDVQQWPGGLYRRAIIRAYAQAIGLEPEEILHEFVRLFSETDAPVDLSAIAPKRREPRCSIAATRHTLAAAGVIAAAAAAAISVATWYVRSHGAAPAAPTRVRPVEAPSSGHSSPIDTTPAAPVGADERRVPQVQAVRQTQPAPAASLDIEGELRIDSVPAGARVTVNGIGWGQTPLTIRYLPMGEKRVRLTKDGYVSLEQRIELTADRPVRTMRVELATVEPTPIGR